MFFRPLVQILRSTFHHIDLAKSAIFSENGQKIAILSHFEKKVWWKKSKFGFKTALKCPIFQEKTSLTKGFHQKKFGVSETKNKNFIQKSRSPPPKRPFLGGGRAVKTTFSEVRLGMLIKSHFLPTEVDLRMSDPFLFGTF